ncbi:MAG: hypothetical protein ACJAVK_003193, partial [Akkermansiaceae bacterium]
MIQSFLLLLLTGLVWAEKPSAEKIEFFETRIRPILAQDCYECHRTGGKKKGGLALDYRAAMAEGGHSDDLFDFENPGDSYLIKVLRHEEKDMEMPKDGAKLDDQVVADFITWIAMGAPDPRDQPPSDEEIEKESSWEQVMARRKQWWSFQPIGKVTPPDGKGAAIDRFLKKEIVAAGLQEVGKADDRILVRRLSFALRGLPPTVAEVNHYLADKRAERWEHLVDDFLTSPQYGERWARHWMDWIRYADSHGSEGDPAINNAWRYRDYLIRALNENVPYDTLVTEHLAGDLLENPRIKGGRNESMLGTAHLRMVFHGFAPTDALDEKVRFTDDQVNVVTKAFQGLTVSCARCHNHKFDAISQEDYYAFFGIFGSTKPGVVRVDAVDERSARAEMAALKLQIKQKLMKHWLIDEKNWAKRFIEEQGNLLKDGRNKNDFLFLRAWDEGKEEMAGYLAGVSKEKISENQAQWFGPELDAWAQHGEGIDGLSESGAFAIAPEGKPVLTGIYPAGLYSHPISDKDRGVVISPRIELKGDEEVWMRVRGKGNAVARYAVQNYPRDGTVFPSNTLNSNRWKWIRHDLSYWEGDRIHLELSTAQDQAILARNDERSWFGLSAAVVAKKGGVNPSVREFQEMTDFMAANYRTGDTAPIFLKRLFGGALSAWMKGEMSASQATFLDELLEVGILPNDSAIAGETLDRYRELEASLAVPVRAPGVWEADAHDQEFYERGDHMKPKHLVKRRFLEAIDKKPYESEQSGRLELAQDFLRSDNPFTARVLVNRVWHHLFGAGLVRTVDNFGRLGEKPTHPELLDYLAARFVEEGWDIKKLIREMVTSQGWQRASAPGSRAQEKDPDNRLLSHFTLRRLDAEAIRDSLISVSGSLDEEMFGNTVDGKSSRRSVYVRTQRNRLDPFLQTFNAPVPLGGKGRRDETNVPAQSLTMLNSDWVMDLADQWAGKVQGETMAAKVTQAYEVAFARKPEPEELKKVLAFMAVMENERSEQKDRRERSKREIQDVESELAKLESTARAMAKPLKPQTKKIPGPIARWDFETDALDQIGDLHGKLHGGAVIENGKLIVGRKNGCFTSSPLQRDLGEKTLQVLVQLDNLTQQGGGALGIQTLDGHTFDSIVFAESIPGQWLSGSEFHSRTQKPGGASESEAHQHPVWMTMTYAKDGMIQVYRNGARYGRAYRKAGLQNFEKGKAQAIIGFRHGQPGGGRLLSGKIDEARLFDRALTEEEVSLSLGMEMPPSRDEVLKSLTDAQRESLQKLEARLVTLRDREGHLNRGPRPSNPLADLAHALFNSKEFIYV